MCDIDRVITLKNVFNKGSATTFELDLEHVRGIQRHGGDNGIYNTYISFVNPDGELESLLIKDDSEWAIAKWVIAQHADYVDARDHEAAGNSTLESKPLPAETVPPEWIKSFA